MYATLFMLWWDRKTAFMPSLSILYLPTFFMNLYHFFLLNGMDKLSLFIDLFYLLKMAEAVSGTTKTVYFDFLSFC